MSSFRLKALMLSLLLAQGCAPKTDGQQPSIAESCPCDVDADRALDGGYFAEGSWPKERWWEMFEEATLNHLIEKALQISPTLNAAESRLKAATQVALQKRASLFPEVDLNAGTNWQHLSSTGFFRNYAPVIPPVVNDMSLNLSFFYEFDFWGKNRMRFESALGQAAALYAEKKQAELIVVTSIAYSYIQLQYLLQEEQILKQIEENNLEIQQIRSKREKNAIDSASFRLFSESRALDSKAALLEVAQLIQKEIHQLKALSGLSQNEELFVQLGPLKNLQVALPENISLNLVARRPDLNAQKARVEAAAKEVGVARTDFYPNVNLFAFVGLESVVWSTLFSQKGASTSLQPAISLPIFTAGRLTAQLREKMEIFNEAIYAYNALILQAAEEIADRLSAISLLQEQIDVRTLSVETTQEEARLALMRYEKALEDRIGVLESDNVVLKSQLTLASLEYGQELAKIQLVRALGGGYDE